MKLPAFESLDEKRDDLAEQYHGNERGNWGPDFVSGFNAGVIERDKQWQSKVSKLIKALSWYARHDVKVTKTECGTGVLHPLAKSALAEFYASESQTKDGK